MENASVSIPPAALLPPSSSPTMALTCKRQEAKPCPNRVSTTQAEQTKQTPIQPNPTQSNSIQLCVQVRVRVRGTPSDHLWQQFRHLAQFSTNLATLDWGWVGLVWDGLVADGLHGQRVTTWSLHELPFWASRWLHARACWARCWPCTRTVVYTLGGPKWKLWN